MQHETRTAVVVMKAKAGRPEETLRYAGVGLRHEPALRRLILHKHETIIGTFADDEVARWYMEDA